MTGAGYVAGARAAEPNVIWAIGSREHCVWEDNPNYRHSNYERDDEAVPAVETFNLGVGILVESRAASTVPTVPNLYSR